MIPSVVRFSALKIALAIYLSVVTAKKIFFDYGYSKEKSKVLYRLHKMKIPNSFSATIFNRHRIQYECGAYAETEFSNVFFFLLATTDRAEDTNQYNQYINQ